MRNIKKIFFIILIALFIPVSVFAQAKVFNLKRADFGGPNEPFVKNGTLYLKEIEKRTNGQVKFTYFTSGSLLKGNESYEGVVKGIADMSFTLMGYTTGRFPLTQLWDIPGPVMETIIGTRILNEMYQKFKPAELSDTTFMYAFQFPGAHLFNTVHPVKTLADLRDLRVRCFGVTTTILKSMGAIPLAMEAGEQAEGLQKGTINGTVAGTTVKTYKLVPPLKYATLAPLTAATGLLVMNSKTWNSLPSDIQQVFREVNKEWMIKDAQGAIDSSDEGIAWAKEKGVQIIEATSEYLAGRDKGIGVLYDEYLKETQKRGVDGRTFLNEYSRLAKEYQK